MYYIMCVYSTKRMYSHMYSMYVHEQAGHAAVRVVTIQHVRTYSMCDLQLLDSCTYCGVLRGC